MENKRRWNLDRSLGEEGKEYFSAIPPWKKKTASWGKGREGGGFSSWQSTRFSKGLNWGKGWNRGWNKGPQWWLGRGFWHKSAIAVLIFALIYGVFQMEHPWAKAVQAGVRRAATVDTDYTPMLSALQHLSQWTDMLQVTPTAAPIKGPDFKAGKTLRMPVNGTVIQTFGWAKSPIDGQKRFSEGISLRAPLGTAVVAPAAGKVVQVIRDAAMGLTLQLDHGQGLTTLLGHLDGVSVEVGQEIKEGQIVGKVGQSGGVSEPQLYMEVREKGELVDPLSLMVVIQGGS